MFGSCPSFSLCCSPSQHITMEDNIHVHKEHSCADTGFKIDGSSVLTAGFPVPSPGEESDWVLPVSDFHSFLIHVIYLFLALLGLFSSYGARAAHRSDFCCNTQTLGRLGSVVVAQKGLIAPVRVGSSQIRDRTHVPCSWQVDFQPLDHQGNPDPHLLSAAFEGIEAHCGQRNSGLNISPSVDKELPWLSRCLTVLNMRSRTKLFFKTIAKYPVLNFLLICISLFTSAQQNDFFICGC